MALLRLPEPYDFELSTGRFRAFGPDLANLWHDGALFRVVGDRERRIAGAPGGALLEPYDEDAAREVAHLLGAPFDLDAFYQRAAADPVLAGLTRRLRGFRPVLAPEPFESLVTSISAQQVSLRAAFAIRNRLISRYGSPAGEHAVAFPRREAVAAATEDDVAALGFSHSKAAAIVGLARSDLNLVALADLADEEIAARLRSLRGIGEWTADWFLARHLARPRAWPAGDLALRKAVSAFYGAGRDLTTQEVREIGARFDPFQNLTAHYLLSGLLAGRWT